MSDRYARTSRSTRCRACEVTLWLAKCECWVDDRGTRYCATGELHDPAKSVQPRRCGVMP